MSRYRAEAKTVDNGEGRMKTLEVDVIDSIDNVRVGGYTRNYASMFRTFLSFSRAGRDYALYSPNYTGTRVMSLPECRDIGGEDSSPAGFCPVDFWIASDPELKLDGDFGLVAGCHWGDDSSWKIQFLDLTRVSEGVVLRDERLGYLELPDHATLDDVVKVRSHWPESDDWAGHYLEVTTPQRIDVATGNRVPSYDV